MRIFRPSTHLLLVVDAPQRLSRPAEASPVEVPSGLAHLSAFFATQTRFAHPAHFVLYLARLDRLARRYRVRLHAFSLESPIAFTFCSNRFAGTVPRCGYTYTVGDRSSALRRVASRIGLAGSGSRAKPLIGGRLRRPLASLPSRPGRSPGCFCSSTRFRPEARRRKSFNEINTLA